MSILAERGNTGLNTPQAMFSTMLTRSNEPLRKPSSDPLEAPLGALVVDELTAIILTYNEEANIGRTLDRLRWVPRILVLDSFSTDRTLEIVRQFENVQVVQKYFDSFAGQCNFALTLVETQWVLSIDADYVLSDELVSELLELRDDPLVAGYQVSFSYWVYGKPLRRTLLPGRTALYRTNRAVYADEGHGHRVRVRGELRRLRGGVNHDDRKPLGRWLAAQCSYMAIEAPDLLRHSDSELTLQDRIRKRIVFAPVLILVYTLLAQRLFMDGWRGWYYVMQRTLVELMLSVHLLDVKMQSERKEGQAREAVI